MKNIVAFFIGCCCSLGLSAQVKTKSTVDIVLKNIEIFDRQQSKADSISGYVLGSLSESYFERRYQFYKQQHTILNSADTSKISFDEQINRELLNYIIDEELSSWTYKEYLNPILADEGFHTSLAHRSSRQFSGKKDAIAYLRFLNDIPHYTEQNLALMRKGLALGISQPRIILNGYENTYNQHIVNNIDSSVFWKPFITKPYSITEADWDSIKAAARLSIQSNVIPAFKSIQQFFDTEYLPKTRTTLGASYFPDGKNFYEEKARHYTTTNLGSEAIYQIGLTEVERIQNEMNAVIKGVGFKGDFKAFINFLRTDPQFYAPTAEQLLKEASYIAKKADGMLPSLFGKLPRQPYGVAPVPAFLAPTYTSGRYSGSSIRSKNAGHYWVNTYNLKSRTLYTLESLTLHEAVPGHHLQTALAQELDHLPDFRRNLYINVFGEGWGLYGEFLGYEMGFYKDPYSRFGRLTYDMWRACRLVIDVGIHTKNWTREQAVAYLADHTALSIHEVNTEINRYISWPGQALAYKIGELRIRQLRSKAEAVLKEKFDVRDFHDVVLSQGSVTLGVLEKMVDRYISKVQAGKK